MSLWNFAGDLVGAGLSLWGQSEAGDAALDAARMQAEAAGAASQAAIDAGTPYTTASLGGVAEFDPESKAALLQLSPELQNIYQGALTRSGLFGGQASQYAMMDPFAAADLFYQQEQPYYEQQEQRQRTDLETRLLAQGRLGGTGGATEQQALEEAIGRGQQGRRTAAFSRAQALIDGLIGRERGDIAQAIGLLDIPLQQAKLGRGIGGDLGNVAGAGLASQAAAQKLLASTQAQAPGLFPTALMGAGQFVSDKLGSR